MQHGQRRQDLLGGGNQTRNHGGEPVPDSHPSDSAGRLLLDHADPVQDVGDVVDAPHADLESLGHLPEVHGAAGSLLHHLQEALSQQEQGHVWTGTHREAEQG